MTNTFTLNPLRSPHRYQVSISAETLSINGVESLNLSFNHDHIYHFDANSALQDIVLETIFSHFPQQKEISINDTTFLREIFYQSPQLWLRAKEEGPQQEMIETQGVSHPQRPQLFEGTHYRRYLANLKKTISFRTITVDDLAIFHEWHNQKRVAFFWELNQSREELKTYIEAGLRKKHQIPMIIELDGEPVGYYEFYWVKEDRLGPYYEARDYDRGFHFLIGNKKFLGKNNTDAITSSGLHFIYLDDPRTMFTMAEPRYDNNKVLKYADESIGWKALKIFDFPHKRAVLLQNSREVFFKGACL